MLAEMESNGAIKIAGAMYNLETGVVDFFAGEFSAGETNGLGPLSLDALDGRIKLWRSFRRNQFALDRRLRRR